MEEVKLSKKGELFIPQAIRNRHHWKAGTELIIIDGGTQLVLKPASVFLPTELEPLDAPSLYRGKALSLEEMEAAIAAKAGKCS